MRVRLSLFLIFGTGLPVSAVTTRSDTNSASSARVFTKFTLVISALKRLVTSRPVLLGVSAHMHGVGVYAGDSQSHLHSHHSLDSVAEMAVMAATRWCRLLSG